MNQHIACTLRIKGRVQGVGFRGALHAEALRLDVGGWVRNRSDGGVEAFLYGEKARVNALVDFCREAPIPVQPENCFPFRRLASA